MLFVALDDLDSVTFSILSFFPNLMGGATSSHAEEDSSRDTVPLPVPQISSSSYFGPIRMNQTVRLAPPATLSVVKKSLPFIIIRDSLKIRRVVDRLWAIGFSYRSDRYLVLKLEVPNAKSDDAVGSAYKTFEISMDLEITKTDGVHDFKNFSKEFQVPPELMKLSSFLMILSDDEEELILEVTISNGTTRTTSFKFIGKDGVVDLQQLFDASGSGSQSSSFSSSAEKMCSICMSNSVSVGFLPCRHACVCAECADITLSSSENHCPICRGTVCGKISLA